jgi:hypothetical protein
MDVLELPRPVINFLRTMSKEMHRYVLCWDIYGGNENVTLTLTWKLQHQMPPHLQQAPSTESETCEETDTDVANENNLNSASPNLDADIGTGSFNVRNFITPGLTASTHQNYNNNNNAANSSNSGTLTSTSSGPRDPGGVRFKPAASSSGVTAATATATLPSQSSVVASQQQMPGSKRFQHSKLNSFGGKANNNINSNNSTNNSYLANSTDNYYAPQLNPKGQAYYRNLSAESQTRNQYFAGDSYNNNNNHHHHHRHNNDDDDDDTPPASAMHHHHSHHHQSSKPVHYSNNTSSKSPYPTHQQQGGHISNHHSHNKNNNSNSNNTSNHHRHHSHHQSQQQQQQQQQQHHTTMHHEVVQHRSRKLLTNAAPPADHSECAKCCSNNSNMINSYMPPSSVCEFGERQSKSSRGNKGALTSAKTTVSRGKSLESHEDPNYYMSPIAMNEVNYNYNQATTIGRNTAGKSQNTKPQQQSSKINSIPISIMTSKAVEAKDSGEQTVPVLVAPIASSGKDDGTDNPWVKRDSVGDAAAACKKEEAAATGAKKAASTGPQTSSSEREHVLGAIEQNVNSGSGGLSLVSSIGNGASSSTSQSNKNASNGNGNSNQNQNNKVTFDTKLEYI